MINEKTDIIEASYTVPILVDFWAEWCGPCRMVGPILEELHREANGAWKLVKVNTEEQPELMERYGIQGIPALKLFWKGTIIAEQVGAQPKHLLKRWLDVVLPGEDKEAWDQLAPRLAEMDAPTALQELQAFVQKYPNHQAGRIAYWKRLVFHKPHEVLQAVTPLANAEPLVDTWQDLVTLAGFLTTEFGNESPVDAQLQQAQAQLQQGNTDAALELLINSIMLHKTAHDGMARKTCIALFHILGEQHPITQKHRTRFNMAVY
ncbi:MAG: thioredoxin [Lacibacter sp.]